MKDARSEHIHATASAISVGLPKRPMGWQLRTYLWTSGAPKTLSAKGVSTAAGHIALIRILFRAFSNAADFVSPITPCLLALYAPAPAEPTRPVIEDIFTIAPPPPCLSICRISYFRQSQTPLRLMLMVRSQSSSDCSAMGIQFPSIPALLNATSKRPNFSTVFCTKAATSAARETSDL